jgi:hypothetical protein
MPEASDYVDMCRAAKLFPGDPSYACIWRWCRRGCKARNGERVYLRSVRVGGKLYTTKQWAEQFLADLAAKDCERFKPQNQPSEPAPTELPPPALQPLPDFRRPRTAQQREADISRAEAIVKSWGQSKQRK